MRNSRLRGLGRISQGALRVARGILAQGNQFKPVNLSALVAAGTLALTGAARAADLPVLTTGHTDVGVNYEDDAWDLHVHAEDLGMEYEPDGVWLKVAASGRTSVPSAPAFSFLGTPGAPLWVLPAIQRPDLLFLGLGTEEMASGIFSNDIVRLTLKSVTGPGDFIMYHLDPFGAPVVYMNSRDEFDTNDVKSLTAGGHSHVNWVFTAPGQYRIGLQASGVLAATGETTTSKIAEYFFEVAYAPILAITRKDTATLTLNWLSWMHQECHLQSRTNLTSGSWQAHAGAAPLPSTGNTMSLDVPVTEGQQFFRIEIQGEHP